MAGVRDWVARRISAAASAPVAETFTSDAAAGKPGTLRAVYVTGPSGGSRHVLPERGVCVIGRGPDSTLVLDDPRVSRSHATLHVDESVTLADLGSANGTFLGNRRLSRGAVVPLALGDTFFVGDTALVLRETTLSPTCSMRLASVAEVGQHFTSPMVLVKLRPLRGIRRPALEAIAGALLDQPHDWLLWLGPEQLVLGFEADATADPSPFERGVLQHLLSWSASAEVESRLVTPDQVQAAGSGLQALLSSRQPVALSRGKVVFENTAMQALQQTVLRIASAAVNVLILGETGAGKDVVASMLHELSARASKPFVGLNCASLPEQLLESELFGYERGAFTGALGAKPGLLEAADGGTVFLDEIGELPLPLQAKLLRVVELREVTRVGALRPRRIDVRFVAATNRDLEQAIATGQFRQDLYYRLNGVSLSVPPLRERSNEIEPLARLFLEEACARFAVDVPALSAAALSALQGYAWPGNVRELRNAIDRAVLLATERVIEPKHLGLPLHDPGPRRHTSSDELGPDAPERERILRGLEACGGNQSRAADLLGIPRRTLVRRIAQLGLRRPRGTNE